MSSQQVEVLVYSGDRQIDGPFPRPVRILPSGEAGVVYGGQVYPLRSGNRVDVTDESFDKYDCMAFVAPGAALPIARATTSMPNTTDAYAVTGLLDDHDWYLESNKFGHYLAFDADAGTADRVVDALDRSTLGVRRWDASHRAADNGRFYGWFVRLLFDGDHDEGLRLVRSLLGGETPDSSALSTPLDDTIPEHLRAAVIEALQKALVAARDNSRLTLEHSELTRRHSVLQREYEEARLALASSHAEVKGTIARQQAQIESFEKAEGDRRKSEHQALQQLRAAHAEQMVHLRSALAAAESERPRTEQQELIHLRSQMAAKEADANHLLDEWVQSDQQARDLTDRLCSAEAARQRFESETVTLSGRLQAAESQLSEMSNESRERHTAERESAPSRVRPNLEKFLAKLFKRCDLDSESIEELLRFDRPGKAIRELMRIDENDEQLRSVMKPVKGYDSWWELSKVHTGASGKSAMGRIYFRPHRDGVAAVVHLKKDDDEQRRFMARRLDRA